ncbi:hypothetical protein AAFF_G00290900 [Aldrovandia affinis]|uniref:Uncharacterized protein n=1 Tax=Aldrovandia affinis TaxID=143900 RepID=A0AAD7W1Z9_9TELE|nr:hypothetical protein AAFF_G00290900 [Aldrovandia affinis]
MKRGARRDNRMPHSPREPATPDGEMETAAGATDERRPSDGQRKGGPQTWSGPGHYMQPPDIAQEVLSYGDGIFSVAPAQETNLSASSPHQNLKPWPFLCSSQLDGTHWMRSGKSSCPQAGTSTRGYSVSIPGFAKDQSYLFFAQFVAESHMATCSMSIQTWKGKKNAGDGRKISNKMLQDKVELEKLIQNMEATHFMQPLRGTQAYWEKTLRDLHAMDPEDCPDVIEFIDHYITCQMPDEKADPERHKIVSEVQIHSRNHSKTCRKGNVSCDLGSQATHGQNDHRLCTLERR